MKVKQIRLVNGFEALSGHATEDIRGNAASSTRKRVWYDQATRGFIVAEAEQNKKDWKWIPETNVAWCVIPMDERQRFVDPFDDGQLPIPRTVNMDLTPEDLEALAIANGQPVPPRAKALPINAPQMQAPSGSQQFTAHEGLDTSIARATFAKKPPPKLPPLDPNNLPE